MAEENSIEIFAVSPLEANYNALESARSGKGDENTIYEPGWYWWKRYGVDQFINAVGPHANYAEALADAQEEEVDAPLSRTERVARQAQWDDQQHQSDADMGR